MCTHQTICLGGIALVRILVLLQERLQMQELELREAEARAWLEQLYPDFLQASMTVSELPYNDPERRARIESLVNRSLGPSWVYV